MLAVDPMQTQCKIRLGRINTHWFLLVRRSPVDRFVSTRSGAGALACVHSSLDVRFAECGVQLRKWLAGVRFARVRVQNTSPP